VCILQGLDDIVASHLDDREAMRLGARAPPEVSQPKSGHSGYSSQGYWARRLEVLNLVEELLECTHFLRRVW
jgi:hypothetical protein